MGKDEGYSEGHRILKTSPGSRWGWITEYLFKEWSTATLYYSNQIPSEILQLSICRVTTITEPRNSLTSLVQSFMAKGALLRLSSTLSSLSLKVFSDGDSTINYLPIHKTSFNFWKTKTRVPFSWPVTFHWLLYLPHTHNCSPLFFFSYAEVQGYTVESCSQSHLLIL